MDKQIILTILLSLVALSAGSYFLFNNSQESPREIVESGVYNTRAFFKQFKKHSNNKLRAAEDQEEYIPLISYGIRHTVKVNELAKQDSVRDTDQDFNVYAECDVQTIFNEEENIFEVAVSYSHIFKVQGGEDDIEEQLEERRRILEQQEEEESEESFSDYERQAVSDEREQRQEVFYLLTVGADSGELLTIGREAYYEQDKTMDWITQQLVNDIFPDLRKLSYKVKPIEHDAMGDVAIKFSMLDGEADQNDDLPDHRMRIEKAYDQNDYVTKNFEGLNTPDVDYDRVVVLDKDSGVVDRGDTHMVFEIGKGDSESEQDQQDDDEEDITAEALGSMDGDIQQIFWLIEFQENKEAEREISKEIERYRNECEFIPVVFINNKGDYEFGNGDETSLELVSFDESTEEVFLDEEDWQEYVEQKAEEKRQREERQRKRKEQEQQQKLSNQFSHTLNVGKVKIFGSHVLVDVVYSGNGATSQIQTLLKVNSHVIRNLMTVHFNNCQSGANGDAQQHDFTLFTASFPVFGLVTINVSAKTHIKYGYNIAYDGNGENCSASFSPFIQAGLYADGKASLAGIISAGVYAQGNFIDAKLTLAAAKNGGMASLNLYGDYQGFTIDVGLVYTKINCSLKDPRKGQLNNTDRDVDDKAPVGGFENRRMLGLRKAVKKTTKTVTKPVTSTVSVATQVATAPVKIVTKTAKRVTNIIDNRIMTTLTREIQKAKDIYNKMINYIDTAVYIVTHVDKICQKKKGFKQLYLKNSDPHRKNIFSQQLRLY